MRPKEGLRVIYCRSGTLFGVPLVDLPGSMGLALSGVRLFNTQICL